MPIFEEKTPKGYTLKIFTEKNSFLVFSQTGGTVYADDAGLTVMHSIPQIAFMGSLLSLKNRSSMEYNLYKISREKIVIPYSYSNEENLRYLMYETDEKIDMVPVKTAFYPVVNDMVKAVDSGYKPDLIVVASDITENDIIVIKNRFSAARILLSESPKTINDIRREGRDNEHTRAKDLLSDVNLNTMSANPVFLARVHLRDMSIAKVKQLLLDFDLTLVDSSYIMAFIDTMLKKRDVVADIKQNAQKLEDLYDEFAFYTAVVGRDEEKVQKLISRIENESKLSSCMTLLAKVKSLLEDYQDETEIIEYENLLYDKKEELKK